jgi:hypothetical protein
VRVLAEYSAGQLVGDSFADHRRPGLDKRVYRPRSAGGRLVVSFSVGIAGACDISRDIEYVFGGER